MEFMRAAFLLTSLSLSVFKKQIDILVYFSIGNFEMLLPGQVIRVGKA